MTIQSYFKLVEIQTKVASVFPFLLGTLYAVGLYGTGGMTNTLILFWSLFLFDMATTAINNYIDYKTARKKDGYGYNDHNAMAAHSISPGAALSAIFTLLSLAVALGLWLWLRTDWVVLAVGIASFAVGVCYTFGPVPISRTPLGEAFSGATMGLLIPFLAVYIHRPGEMIRLTLDGSRLLINLDWTGLLGIALLALPSVCGIANIMLANNICDVEDDIANRRSTLVTYIGVRWGLWLFAGLYAVAFLGIAAVVALGFLPAIYLLALLCALPIGRNICAFFRKQSKGETFVLAVKSFVLLEAVCVVLLIAVNLWFRP